MIKGSKQIRNYIVIQKSSLKEPNKLKIKRKLKGNQIEYNLMSKIFMVDNIKKDIKIYNGNIITKKWLGETLPMTISGDFNVHFSKSENA